MSIWMDMGGQIWLYKLAHKGKTVLVVLVRSADALIHYLARSQ